MVLMRLKHYSVCLINQLVIIARVCLAMPPLTGRLSTLRLQVIAGLGVVLATERLSVAVAIAPIVVLAVPTPDASWRNWKSLIRAKVIFPDEAVWYVNVIGVHDGLNVLPTG